MLRLGIEYYGDNKKLRKVLEVFQGRLTMSSQFRLHVNHQMSFTKYQKTELWVGTKGYDKLKESGLV